MTAQTDAIARITRFGVTTASGDEWLVTATERHDGWVTVDATLPNGYWGTGPDTLTHVYGDSTAPTLDTIMQAIDTRVALMIDAAWYGTA